MVIYVNYKVSCVIVFKLYIVKMSEINLLVIRVTRVLNFDIIFEWFKGSAAYLCSISNICLNFDLKT